MHLLRRFVGLGFNDPCWVPASTTELDACLFRKSPGCGAILYFMDRAQIENRNWFIVRGNLT